MFVAASPLCKRARAACASWASVGARAPRRRPLATSVSPVAKPIIPDKIVEHPYLTKNMKYLPGFSFPAPRKLDQIVKLQLMERESTSKIKQVWNDFHDRRLDSVATVWTQAEFQGIAERKRRCPRFVYPVLKGDGKYFSLVAEWQDNFCIFTFLDDYKRNPSGAEPYLSVALYDDLLERKQLVLVRGDFSGHLTKRDAAHMLNLMRVFYFQEPKWVETFNRDPREFDWTAFVAACPPPPAASSLDAGKLIRDATTTGKMA